MAKYKIESTLTTSIDFADRSIGVPSIAELSDEELVIVRQVASAEKVEGFATGGKIDSLPIIADEAGPDQIVNKHTEKHINKKLDFDQK